jgi:hypothetical protein
MTVYLMPELLTPEELAEMLSDLGLPEDFFDTDDATDDS